MRRWKHSQLSVGQRVIIPPTLLATNETKNLLFTEYIGETEHGLLLELHFKEGMLSNDHGSWKYCRFIDWNSIYIGQVMLRNSSGELIRAEKAVI